MYFLDPQRGKRRRALVRDKTTHAAHVVGRQIGKTSRDLRNRTRGLVAETTSALRPNAPQPDDTLQERIRSTIGHVIGQPGNVQVKVQDGVVTLKGSLPEQEHTRLRRKVEKVAGVREVRDKLTSKVSPASGSRISYPSNGRERNRWGRSTGITLASTAAGMLATYGAKRAGLIE